MAGNFAWSELTFGNDEGIVLDPSRVVAYVVTGVGFLGAGAIIKYGGSVRGLTTAASLWVVAAIGVVVASGEYWLGVIAAAAVLLSLWPVRRVAALLGLRTRRGRRLVVELDRGARIGEVVRLVEASGADVVATSLADEPDRRLFTVWLSGKDEELVDLVDEASADPSVQRVSLDG
jgi:putative Mg2+ transporter-C (MgtC) family protein